MPSFADTAGPRTDRSITILDGGMGKELERIGAPFGQPEWSARALLDDPDFVLQAHRNFIEAGADVIIANSYAVVPFHLGADRFAASGRELAELAGRLARRAADEAPHPVRVAASLPPVFGSYSPADFDPVRAPAIQQLLIEAQAPHVDLWLAETIGSCAEAASAMVALERAGVGGDRWLSFSLADELMDGRPVLWSGESVVEGVKGVVADGADAVLLNCASPEAVTLALPDMVATVEASGRPVPIGAYANAFPPKAPGYAANEVLFAGRHDLTPRAYTEHVRRWVAAGATIVGGCCCVHPEHIAALVDADLTAGVDPSPPTGSPLESSRR